MSLRFQVGTTNNTAHILKKQKWALNDFLVLFLHLIFYGYLEAIVKDKEVFGFAIIYIPSLYSKQKTYIKNYSTCVCINISNDKNHLRNEQ